MIYRTRHAVVQAIIAGVRVRPKDCRSVGVQKRPTVCGCERFFQDLKKKRSRGGGGGRDHTLVRDTHIAGTKLKAEGKLGSLKEPGQRDPSEEKREGQRQKANKAQVAHVTSYTYPKKQSSLSI